MRPAWVAAAVWAPLLAAVLLLALTGQPRAQRALSLGAAAFTLLIAALILAATRRGEILVVELGGWSPQVGIVWVADALAALMLFAASVVSGAALLYSSGVQLLQRSHTHSSGVQRGPREARYFYPLVQLMMVGVNGSLLTGDLFNLFVFFEVMLLASFALLALGARPGGARPAIAYVVVNLVASALFLGGVGAIYGATGTVNLALLAAHLRAASPPDVFWPAAALVLVVFMLKAALAPLFLWLPDAYPEASPAENGLFAGLLTKVGIYTLFRVVPLMGAAAPEGLRSALLVIAGATMLIGVVGALGRSTIRGILSFHIVSQVGYMIFGLALLSPLALAAGLFHTAHNMIAKTALILAGGIAESVGGSGKLGEVRGLSRSHPWVAVAFLVPALSLSGLPPLSGFWGKLWLVIAGVRGGAYVVAGLSLAVGLLTLASMLKIYSATFWGEVAGQRAPAAGHDRSALGATLSLGAVTILLGLLVGPVFAHLERTAAALLRVTPYVEAVLGSAIQAR